MSQFTTRRLHDTERARKVRRSGRKWLAIALAVFTAAVAFTVLGQDIDWENRRREARQHGLAAQANGDFEAARRFYLVALANHPYDWETHLSLARILNYRLNDYTGALRHYLYALGYSPQNSIAPEVKVEMAMLKMVFRGELENPGNALEEMFRAVEEGADELFFLRLSRRLRDSHPDYWRGWKERGRGKMVYCRMRDESNGFFDAHIGLAFPDGTSMSMHMYCVKGQMWRLEFGFP